MTANRVERIRARAQAHVDAGVFSGIEWQIAKAGELWQSGRVGHADATNGVALPEVPIYRIYSMTKPVIAAVVMMLVEEGRMRLMDPVAAYIPEIAAMPVHDGDGSTRPQRTMMTIEHLLTHRAGFSYGFLHSCPVGSSMRGSGCLGADKSLAQVVEQLTQFGLAFDPGTGWQYSASIDVVARIVEIVEGTPLQQVLQTRVFEPLGLTDTGFMVPEPERHRVITMFGSPDLDSILEFDAGPQTLRPTQAHLDNPVDNPDFARGGHGLFSTVSDYLRIARCLADGRDADDNRLISRIGLEMLWANRILERDYPLRLGPIALHGYGYSLAGRVAAWPGHAMGHTTYGEVGWAGAASTYFWIDPREDVIGVIMAQYLGSKVPLGDDMRVAVNQALDD
jgi:CubicO group peptidase (beta-lactamase class C family)